MTRPSIRELATQYVLLKSGFQTPDIIDDTYLLMEEMCARVGVSHAQDHIKQAEDVLKILGG